MPREKERITRRAARALKEEEARRRTQEDEVDRKHTGGDEKESPQEDGPTEPWEQP